MLNFLKSKKKKNIVLILLLIICFSQALLIAKMYDSKDDKVYNVNIVKINNEKVTDKNLILNKHDFNDYFILKVGKVKVIKCLFK